MAAKSATPTMPQVKNFTKKPPFSFSIRKQNRIIRYGIYIKFLLKTKEYYGKISKVVIFLCIGGLLP